MLTVPVFRGEFGVKIRAHVPIVHAMPGPKVVEIEEGEEALYPSAERWVVVPRGDDFARRGMSPMRGEEARFVPRPHVEPEGLPVADVVVCPRHRRFVEARNWSHWAALAESLQSSGVSVIAAGAPDSSAPVPCPATWKWPRFLDATIRAILDAKLVVATDSGLAHLAVLCGTPLLIITHAGRCGDGPIIDSRGRVHSDVHWYADPEHYYEEANHLGVPIRLIDSWHGHKAVAEWITGFLATGDGPSFPMPEGYEKEMAPPIVAKPRPPRNRSTSPPSVVVTHEPAEWLDDLVAAWMPGDSYAPTPEAIGWLRAKHAVAARVAPKSIAEIGVRAGYSAFAMLSAAPEASYLGIDAGDPQYGDGAVFRAHAGELLARFPSVEIRHESSHAIDRLPPVDLLHIDGDHSYEGARSDLDLARRSGVKWALVDDYDYIRAVKRAVLDWTRDHRVDWEHIPDGHRGSALIPIT